MKAGWVTLVLERRNLRSVLSFRTVQLAPDHTADPRGDRPVVTSGAQAGVAGRRLRRAAAAHRDWLAEELPFLQRERPWEKATLIVDGATHVPTCDDADSRPRKRPRATVMSIYPHRPRCTDVS